MSKRILPPHTAATDPGSFDHEITYARGRTGAAIVITLLILVGFCLRTGGLGTESLGEDELNKLETVREYRANGLTGKNGEHPFLMKGLQTVSTSAAERWNAVAGERMQITPEASLRFPLALAGTFSVLLIFLLASSLFGRSIGLIAAGLYALEPVAIGFDRIAKEDGLVVFFFLLTMLLWVRSQTAAERGLGKWAWYAWGAAASFAALMASKYYPHFLAILGGYYNIFKNVPGNKWNMEPRRWIIFFFVMGIAFLILNPTIMLPDTWREMLKFSTENRIGHDSYEYMGELYPNKMSAWLAGVPWTFYYVFLAIKTSLPTLVFLLAGIPLMFRKKMGDGRFLIFFWAFLWFLPFTVLGGKFTRYFAFVTPVIFIIAATGIYYFARWAASFVGNTGYRRALETGLVALFLAIPLVNSLTAMPHFRLFANSVGGQDAAGAYFPHDEFYDAATRDIVQTIAERAGTGAAVACETPGLFEYYSDLGGREDIRYVSLSDKAAVAGLTSGDLVAIVRGRRYVSNTPLVNYLANSSTKVAEFSVGGVSAAALHMLDEAAAADLRSLVR